MDPLTLALIMYGVPAGLNFLGGLFDNSEEDANKLNQAALDEKIREFNLSQPANNGLAGITGGNFLSRLLEQKGGIQDKQANAQGFIKGGAGASLGGGLTKGYYDQLVGQENDINAMYEPGFKFYNQMLGALGQGLNNGGTQGGKEPLPTPENPLTDSVGARNNEAGTAQENIVLRGADNPSGNLASGAYITTNTVGTNGPLRTFNMSGQTVPTPQPSGSPAPSANPAPAASTPTKTNVYIESKDAFDPATFNWEADALSSSPNESYPGESATWQFSDGSGGPKLGINDVYLSRTGGKLRSKITGAPVTRYTPGQLPIGRLPGR